MVLVFVMLFVVLTVSGSTKWSGRVMSLIDPSYAKDNMPLVASISEHSPAMWVNYWQDMGIMLLFVPLGFYYTLVHKLTHGKIFIAMYGVFCVYFSCAMIRLMLVLAPAVCCLAGIGVSQVLSSAIKSIRLSFTGYLDEEVSRYKVPKENTPKPKVKKQRKRFHNHRVLRKREC